MCEDQPHTCHLSVAHFLVSKIWYQLIDKIVNGSLIAAVAIALLSCEMQKKVEPAGNRRCLVLSDGYVSEYAWGPYSEAGYPPSHPGHEYFVRGVLDWAGRFDRWLEGWDVKQLDLEKNKGKISRWYRPGNTG